MLKLPAGRREIFRFSAGNSAHLQCLKCLVRGSRDDQSIDPEGLN
jgi:hypothetical protein